METQVPWFKNANKGRKEINLVGSNIKNRPQLHHILVQGIYLGSANNPVMYMVASSTCSRQCAWQFPGFDDFSTTFPHRIDVLIIYPVKTLDHISPVGNRVECEYRMISKHVFQQSLYILDETRTGQARNFGLPMIISNKFSDRLLSNVGGGNGIIGIWILGWRMISPYDYILYISNVNI